MCGIWGILSTGGAPALTESVAEAKSVLAHRGPDDSGIRGLGSAAFGHTRLSILGPAEPESVQPCHTDQFLLSFNGEIYNFKEIGGELADMGVATSMKSDTEILFKALAHWGVGKTLERLDGMFAFAWYDLQQNRLSLCRDPMGEKFLYWGGNNERIAFGSEIKAVLACDVGTTDPNLNRINDFFFTGKINGAATIFKDVNEVEPGTWVEFDGKSGEATIRRYWDILDIDPKAGSEGDSLFQNLFPKAVRSRRISDVPIGVLLSGGIDSNALVRELVEDKPASEMNLYFANNKSEALSEANSVRQFMEHIQSDFPESPIHLNDNILGYEDYNQKMRVMSWHYDEPLQFMNSPLLSGLCDMARRDGLKVLLSGEGSDEILHGYVRFARTTQDLGPDPSPDDVVKHLYYGGGVHNTGVVQELCGTAWSEIEASEVWTWLSDQAESIPQNRLQLLFSQRYRLQTLLQRQDRIGMASSIEIRVPFLSPWLVRAMNGLPIDALFDQDSGTTKLPLRHAMKDRLPRHILTKKKDGFPSDMHDWLREDRFLSELKATIEDKNSFSRWYLDLNRVTQLLETHRGGQQRFDVLVWLLFSLETWHSVFTRSDWRSIPS